MNVTDHSPTPEQLMAYLDGEVPASEREAIDAHVRTCLRCRAAIEDLRGVSRQLDAWKVDVASARLIAPAHRRNPIAWILHRPAVLTLSGAAAVVLLVLAAQYQPLLRSRRAATESASMSETVARDSVARAPAQKAMIAALEEKRAVMLARTASLDISAADFDALRPAIDRILRETSGYLGSIDVSGTKDTSRSLRTSLRVPEPKLDAALNALKALGRVLHESQNAEDVGDQMVDLDARLTNARATEKRLADIMTNRTGKVADILEVEREIARVRTEIEQMDAQKKNLTDRVQFAIISFTANEESKASISLGPLPVSERLKVAIARGIESAVESLIAAVLTAAAILPTLAVWGLLLGGPIWVYRRRTARRHAT